MNKSILMLSSGGRKGARVKNLIATSNNSNGMIFTSSSDYASFGSFRAMDGLKLGAAVNDYTGGFTWNNEVAGWWQVKFAEPLLIKNIDFYNKCWSDNLVNLAGRFYTSSAMTTPVGSAISTGNTNWQKVVIPVASIVTDTLYFNKTSGNGYAGIGELELEAYYTR